MLPAGTRQAFPERGGITKESVCWREDLEREAKFWYSLVGGWRGESAEVGKYAGAGGMSCLDDMFELWV